MPFNITAYAERGLTVGQKVQNRIYFRFFLSRFHSLMKMFWNVVHPTHIQVTTMYEEPTRPSARGIFS